MEEQKILFADLYRLLGSIKSELKDAGKEIERLLLGGEWESVSMTVNGIISEAALIVDMARAMIENADFFLQHGPYPGQTAGALPLESMAKKE